jgi:glucose/arabinose dehydrogenase
MGTGRNCTFSAATVFAAAVVLSVSVSMASATEDRPGQRFFVDPAKLPKPYATPDTRNSPEVIERPPSATLRVPPGFRATIFAREFEHARWMTIASNGDVLLVDSDSEEVVVLRDADGDGKAEFRAVLASGFRQPHGIAIHRGHLYVADVVGVWRFPYRAGQTTVDKASIKRITADGALGSGDGHWTRNIIFTPDGTRFLVSIGSNENLAEEKLPRATIQMFKADGSGQQTYATGLRNAVGIAFYPGTSDLYAVVNERDGMGDGLVPDYLTRVRRGAFYGWPYAYVGPNPQPGFAQRRPDLVAKTQRPDLLFQSHSAPIGLVFYTATQFPKRYRGGAFVSLRGSGNSAKPTGYKVVFVPFKNRRPVGHYENFATGWWADGTRTARVWGRPAGLVVAKDGSLLVADDTGDVIWRIAYKR